MMSNEIKLPSGASLKVGLAPFADSKELYQVMAQEMTGLKLEASREMDFNFFKDIACMLLSSKAYEKALWKCFDKCLYNGERINEDSFEEEKAREDYFEICFHVSKANIMPFTKTLMQKYSEIINDLLSFASQK